MAVEEIEFGEHAFGAQLRRRVERQRALQRHGLAGRPQPDIVGLALAPQIIGILAVMLLQRREQVHLERDARMARRHDAVVDELARPGAAEMAIEADARADLGVLQRDHALRHVARVAGADRGVRLDPVLRAAMARFAADTVAFLEARAARAGGIGVAAQAHRRAGGIADAQPRRDRLAARPGDDAEGARMSAARRRFFLPQLDLVLADDLAVAFLAPVAGRTGTARHAQMLRRITGCGLGGGGGGVERDEQRDEREREAQARGQPGGEARAKARNDPVHLRVAPY